MITYPHTHHIPHTIRMITYNHSNKSIHEQTYIPTDKIIIYDYVDS